MKAQIPWLRVFVEGVVIVGSILLAFGIQAGWDERQVRLEERAALQGMREDFVASQRDLAGAIRSVEENREWFARFRASPPDEISQTHSDSVGLFLSSFVPARTFDPYLGTLNGLVGAGKLDLIRDSRLRAGLASWLNGLEDLGENALGIRAELSRVIHAMEPFGGPFYRPVDRPDLLLSVVPPVDVAALSAMRADDGFMGSLRSLHYALAFYLRELEQLAGVLDSTLVLIDQNIR